MAGIFISYRKADTQHAAGRLAYELGKVFGSADIFRDVESIDPGLDFEVALDQALAGCALMLVMIGPRWLDVTDEHGGRRLDRPGDWVRTEVSVALQRGIRLIPVLVEDTPLPDEAQLPEPLRALTKRQALPLSDGRWKGDIERLVETLSRIPGLERRPRPEPQPPSPAPSPAPMPAPAPARRGLWTGVLLGAGGLVVLALLFGEQPEPNKQVVPVDDSRAAPSPPLAGGPQAQPEDAGDASADPPVPPTRQVVVPAPSPPQAATAAVPDFNGLWRTLSGEAYDFEQNGAQVRFTALLNGQPVGSGQGRYAQGQLRLTMSVPTPNGVFNVNCDLQATLGEEHWAGMCLGPQGAFAAQMFR